MRYLDVCSGISAPTAAWRPLGWQALCYAEIEAAPRAVLSQHYPEVPLVGDFTQIRGDEYGPVDLLVGGTPCQSFSVAGLRGGLADERGNLALEYLRLADRARPRWLVWENVPGVLSSNGGRDFGTFLGALGELGYGFAYAVLDAQHFGVPQRRRRVFVVGYLGDWRRAAAVLFERHSLSGDSPPRREKGERVADSLTVGANQCSGFPGGFTDVNHSLRAEGFDASEDGTGRGTPLVPVAIQERAVCENPDAGPDGAGFRTDGQAYTLEARTVPQAVAFNITPSNSNKDYNARESERAQAVTAGGNRPSARGGDLIVADTLTSNGDAHSGYRDEKGLVPVAFAQNSRDEVRIFGGDGQTVGALAAEPGMKQQSYIATSAVRRLTPEECEKLQGFPPGFTLVPYRKGMMADGPRYKMLGNSMAVPVVRWIGERIQRVDAIEAKAQAA